MPETYDIKTHQLRVLSSMFMDRRFYIRAKIKPEEFKNPRLKRIAEEYMNLKKEAYPEEDARAFLFEAARRAETTVDDIINEPPLASEYHLQQMRFYNKQEQLKKLTQDSDTLSPEELMAGIQELNASQISFKSQSEVDLTEYAKELYPEYLKKRREKQEGIYSGRPLFDKIVGLERGQLCTLAARPSIGKSALALNLAYEWAQYGFRIYYASLEMSVEELTHRVFARINNISSTKFKYGNVVESWMATAQAELTEMPGNIHLAFLPGSTIEEILQNAAAKMPDILIIDHIDLIRNPTKGDSEAYAIAQMTSAMKAFAGQKNCLVFCLSQFNRESKGGMPELHQLRGSGAKEQDSDVVLILHRSLDPDAEDFVRAKLRIAKNRSGQVGDIPLKFKPDITFFYE